MIHYTPHTVELPFYSEFEYPKASSWIRSMKGALVVDFRHKVCLVAQGWWVGTNLHRENGPAYTLYLDGRLHQENWFQNGKIHRDRGPANIFFNEDGSVYAEFWMRDGQDYDPSTHERLAWMAAQRSEARDA